MNDETIYEDTRIRITNHTLEIGAMSYPTTKIEGVMQPLQMEFEFFGGFLLNGALALFGLWCISHFSTWWVIGGLVAVTIGGFNVKNEFNRPYWIPVKIAGEVIRIERNNKTEIESIYSALRTVVERQ
ncbi:MAG: DUF6232 family protein [Candidatus Thiodiazotropha endolucinida]|nr:hypothetical protein [Candidatus Thiodiazotropha sp. (ex Codakia orbicularis)]